MLAISVDANVVQQRLVSLPEVLRAALLAKSGDLIAVLRQKVDENLNGGVLQSKTGQLKGSIADSTQETGNGVSAEVFVSGDVPYAAIQEYGGVTKAHIIEATNAKALAFTTNGKQTFAKYINHPGSVIPERSYLRSALEDMSDEIVNIMADGVAGIGN